MEDNKMASRYLICITFFSLFGCSNQALTTRKTEAQSKPAVAVSTPADAQLVTELVRAVGSFTNVESNGEHQWGYSIKIWKQGDKIFGLISGDSASRLVGDPPTGILENVIFDAKTGKISFRATLPSDVYEFDGILTKKYLAGKLLNTTLNKIEKITLPKSIELSAEMEEYQSYEEWKVYVDRILKFRGSK